MPVVLLSYYGVALPAGCALGFSAGWGARGMVAGMLGGKLLHATAFAVLVATTDWEAERRRAARRVADEAEVTAEGGTAVAREREAAAAMGAALGGEGERAGGAACELAERAGTSHGGEGAGAGADTGAGLVAGRPGARRARATDKVQLLAECSSRTSCSDEGGCACGV